VVDQQPGAETDQLPEDENHEQIVGEHDADHREHEDRQPAEEPRLRRIVVHVAEREDVDQEADEADDEEHERGEVVELEAERDGEIPELQPLPGGGEIALAVQQQRSRRWRRRGAGGAVESHAAAAPRRRRNSAITAAESERQERPGSGSRAKACHGLKRSSVLQVVEFLDLDRVALAEERDDDGEADRDLGRGDGEDEEDEDVAVERAVEARERDQRERRGDEHQLEAHVDHERVLAQQHAEEAEGEQQRAERAGRFEADRRS
jgi:hypothetical protein